MKARVKAMLFKVAAAIIFWALCKNKNLMLAMAKKIISELTLKELLKLSFDVKDAVKNVK